MYLKGKGKKWMIVVMCKETETIKKKKKIKKTNILRKCIIKLNR